MTQLSPSLSSAMSHVQDQMPQQSGVQRGKLGVWALFFLQWIPLLLLPPSAFLSGAPVNINVAPFGTHLFSARLTSPLIIAIVVIIALLALGFAVLRGRSWALTLSIFLQGFNVIVRLMMLMSRAVRPDGGVEVEFVISSLLAIAISWYVLYRLDRPDIRVMMVK